MDEDLLKVILFIGFIVSGIVIFPILYLGFDMVPAGHVGVINTFGEVGNNILEPGLHWTGIFTHTIPMSFQIQKAEYSSSAASKDMQVVSTKITLNYKLMPNYAIETYKTIGSNYQDVILQPIVQESIKAQTAKYAAEELITLREEVKNRITEAISNKLSDKGVVVTEVAITDFDFSQSFNQAIEAKQVAEQEALRAINQKKQLITESEARAERLKLESDANAYQVKVSADANAYQIKVNADAEAYALRIVREELIQSQALLEYKTIDKWNGQLPTYLTDSNENLLLSVTK